MPNSNDARCADRGFITNSFVSRTAGSFFVCFPVNMCETGGMGGVRRDAGHNNTQEAIICGFVTHAHATMPRHLIGEIGLSKNRSSASSVIGGVRSSPDAQTHATQIAGCCGAPPLPPLPS